MLLKDVLVQDGTIALVPAVKGVHFAVDPWRAQSADDRLPDLLVESVGVGKNNGRGGSRGVIGALERGSAAVGVACEFEGGGGSGDDMADDVESGANSC